MAKGIKTWKKNGITRYVNMSDSSNLICVPALFIEFYRLKVKNSKTADCLKFLIKTIEENSDIIYRRGYLLIKSKLFPSKTVIRLLPNNSYLLSIDYRNNIFYSMDDIKSLIIEDKILGDKDDA